MRRERAISASEGLASAAVIVAVGFLGSRLLGLLRTVAIAESFGTSPELGAYWVAFRLPDMLFQVLAGATLASAFIPIFSRYFTRRAGRKPGGWPAPSQPRLRRDRSAGAARLLLAPLLVPIMAPGLGEDSAGRRSCRHSPCAYADHAHLAHLLLRERHVHGISYARHHFLFPAWRPGPTTCR